MRGLTKRWQLRSTQQPPAWGGGQLSDSAVFAGLDLPPLVQRVLLARGLCDALEIQHFCEPRLAHLCDPALMPNMDVAAKRIIDAIRRNEMIVIYGDYDVDGITATAILYHIIKTIQPTARVRTYVPHRLDEGYGLNCEALQQLKAEGADLVITVDCGITAMRSAQTAREINLDLIITDHHEVKGIEASRHQGTKENESQDHSMPRCLDALMPFLPPAIALVHPRLPGSAYPFGELCGAGVAFKLAWQLAKLWCNSERVSEGLQHTLVNMLPLVALGTIADVVPLVGENRVLTAFGLRLIKDTQLTGLRSLIEASGLMDEKIDSERVGFVLAPRLNACGRMGHAEAAVRLLTDASPEEAMTIARQLTEHNQHRQGVERQILEQAMQMAQDTDMTADDHRVIVLAHESWHPGVVGIVCSRLVERFGRPVVLMHKGRDLCKGSARSIDGYSIHDGLAAGAQFLTTFGGHAMAAGLSVTPDQLGPFTESLVAHANEHISIDQLTASIIIDCETSLMELDYATVQRLQALSPFGRANRPPTLLVRNVTLAEPPKQMGANGKHLSLQLRQEDPRGRQWMRAVWWSAGERAADLAAGMQLDLVIEPKLNAWNNRVSVEGQLRDVRICEPSRV